MLLLIYMLVMSNGACVLIILKFVNSTLQYFKLLYRKVLQFNMESRYYVLAFSFGWASNKSSYFLPNGERRLRRQQQQALCMGIKRL